MPNDFVIFSLSDSTMREEYVFLRYISQREALGELTWSIDPIIGMWEGRPERSYLMSCEDYSNLDIAQFTKEEDCVLIVNNDMSCYLADSQDLSLIKSTGKMEQENGLHSTNKQNWSYNQSLGLYFRAS